MTDPYVYENGVLKNKLNIRDYEKLNQAEADIGFLKLINIDSIKIDYFDEETIKRLHHHIFEDIFEWAGKYRVIPLYKEELVLPMCSINYSEYRNISKDLKECLNDLNSIAWQNLEVSETAFLFARKLALLWKVHPFRDGNTRTILSFAYLYAKEHGFPFDMKTFTEELSRKEDENGKTIYSVRDKFVLACLDEKDYPEVGPLASVFERAIETYDKSEVKAK
ncbi:MAG: Fic family protein [Bacilli bacterium]|nr:Fic family protein [Bacilli bacterium]